MSGSSTPSCANCGSLPIWQRLQGLLRDMVPPAEESSAAIHLLETNDPPLEVEMHAVRETITKEEARLRILDENIAHMQSVLAALSQKRDESKVKIRLHRAIISPLRRLPPEILGLVFSHTIPPLDELERMMEYTSFKFGTDSSPWVLTRICSRWRNISMSSPSLWTNIVLSSTLLGDPATSEVGSFDTSDEELPLVEYPLDMLNAQLTRSGNAPFTVVVRVLNLPNNTLTVLLESSTRWVRLALPNGSSLCTSLSGRVPSLREIEITESWTIRSNNNNVLVAPALHHIWLQAHFVPFILPWTQITCYQARGTWAQHLDVLPLMVNLLEAHLFLLIGDPGGSQVIVPSLRRLYLQGRSLIPDTLILPALEDLFIFDVPFESFSWLQHSPCQAKRLAITISGYAAENIFDFFQQFPSVTDLTITANVMPERAVETNVFDIFEQLQNPILLPSLNRIALHFCFDEKLWVFNDVVDFIRSRQKHTSHPLRCLSLGGSKYAFTPSVDLYYEPTLRLTRLQEDGLHVDIDTVTRLEEWYQLHGWEPRF
ncbi:hypothetical protein DFH06DRAFT_1101562 [Mycena polygramma]|nr:hypothetical protein DFH06DRAFT_1101562 [Mycena polygramma]